VYRQVSSREKAEQFKLKVAGYMRSKDLRPNWIFQLEEEAPLIFMQLLDMLALSLLSFGLLVQNRRGRSRRYT